MCGTGLWLLCAERVFLTAVLHYVVCSEARRKHKKREGEPSISLSLPLASRSRQRGHLSLSLVSHTSDTPRLHITKKRCASTTPFAYGPWLCHEVCALATRIASTEEAG